MPFAPDPTPAPSPSVQFRLDGYAPVARAIDFLVDNFESRPSLEDAAAVVGMSPAHFQRVFKAGAGVSPKRFLQHLSACEAKAAMERGESVLDAALSAGLSGPSRLHDLFLVAEGMTPGAFRRKGEGEVIRYARVEGPFGSAVMGATDKGVCALSFIRGGATGAPTEQLRTDWPAATLVEDEGFIRPLAARAFAFARGLTLDQPLGLHVQGTNFQLRVWRALLDIPLGETRSYGEIAEAVGAPRASRAVGAAVGANLVALLIPCHRVILASGAIHNYRGGVARKRALLALEQAIRAA